MTVPTLRDVFQDIFYGSLEQLTAFIDAKGEVNGLETMSEDPLLIVAIECNNVPALRLLLENGANPNISGYWSTPLAHAVDIYGQILEDHPEENLAMLKLLLNHGADPYQKGNSEQSALDIASMYPFQVIIELLNSRSEQH